MKDWKGLMDNPIAKEMYETIVQVHEGKSTLDIDKKKINDLATQLNEQGFNDKSIEIFLDWKYRTEKMSDALKAMRL